ncbi:unnamed protein product [Mesocestoides corti]|uniref:Secreted protein n=1 Tax=Mesocestoides corti TaxID=53468 RepID=A0A0R3U7Q0_MESCO|nr:unnamed protein product [Mesocestoides corti]
MRLKTVSSLPSAVSPAAFALPDNKPAPQGETHTAERAENPTNLVENSHSSHTHTHTHTGRENTSGLARSSCGGKLLPHHLRRRRRHHHQRVPGSNSGPIQSSLAHVTITSFQRPAGESGG